LVNLGINVDHVATIRQARGTAYPDPLDAARDAIRGGADQITIHLREDRRHIQDADAVSMREALGVPLNLEMAASDEIVAIALRIKPDTATLVPEKRQELTTEGGLDAVANRDALAEVVGRLMDAGIAVSIFIDPEESQVSASRELGAQSIELHTGAYCDARDDRGRAAELERLMRAARVAKGEGLKVCAGHGINYDNARDLSCALPEVSEYNIGHAIVARAIFVGMEEAAREMKVLLQG